MPDKKKSIFILAGEPSGDRLGAELAKKLKKYRQNINFIGVGGDKLQAQGLKTLFDMKEISVMGFGDVIKNIPKLLWRIEQIVKYILQQNPDIIVLIDSQVLSYLVAKKLRRKNFSKPIILYVAPSVWAWKPQRAKKIAPLFDEVFALFPFEVEVMKKLKGPKTTYVGHPALNNIILQNNENADKTLLAIYPGSRRGEIKRHLPLFKKIIDEIDIENNFDGLVLPTLKHLKDGINEQIKGWDIVIKIIDDDEEKRKIHQKTKLALVSAGTISLELALAKVPMVGSYVPDRLQLYYYNKSGRPLIGLPNIILRQEIIKEIYPDENLIPNLVKEAKKLLHDKMARQEQILAFEKMANILKTGHTDDRHEAIRQDAAKRILAYLE